MPLYNDPDMKEILARPWVWFIPQVVVLFIVFTFSDGFQLTESGDSETFVGASQLSFGGYLADEGQLVPYGYPFFLKCVRKVFGDFKVVPCLHLVAHVVAVLLFYAGLRGAVASAWLAMLAASTLLYSNLMLLHG